MKHLIFIALFLSSTFSFPLYATTRVVNDITSKTTWLASGGPYILDGYIFVEDTLIIEPGAVIKGMSFDPANNILPGGVSIPGSGGGSISDPNEFASALIIQRNGFLDAQGTAANPIIFTAVKDDLNSPTDLDCDDTGLWGGVVILGNAVVSSPDANNNGMFVENTYSGIFSPILPTILKTRYGGNNDNDNSGVIRYVSIRHAGASNQGFFPEGINGLTLAGVGGATNISYIEIIACLIDGIKFLGGRVDVRFLAVACASDDNFGFALGHRGRGQFWVGIGTGDVLAEHNGGDQPATAFPNTTPVVFNNATYIGVHPFSSPVDPQLMIFKNNGGGNYFNSVFFQSGKGIEVEFRYDRTNSFERFSGVTNDPILGTIQSLNINNSIFSHISGSNFYINESPIGFYGGINQIRAIANANATLIGLSDNTVSGTDNLTLPNILSTSPISNPNNGSASYDLRPTSLATNLTTPPNDGFFQHVGYSGAVDPSDPNAAGWLLNWTAIYQYGLIQ